MPLRTATMNSTRTTVALAAACTFLLGACSSTPSRESAPVQVDAMVTWIERVHVEAERSQLAIAESFERLNVIAAGRFDKEPAAQAYARFVQSTDEAAQQAKRFREVVQPMVETAQPVFVRWQQDLQTITSEKLRQRGEMRYAVAKQRYDAITKVAVPSQQTLDAYVKELKDHAAFLAHDLNASAIQDIQAGVKDIAKTVLELDRDLKSCMAAARAYVDESSLPAAPAR